jgi:hypothetical protein
MNNFLLEAVIFYSSRNGETRFTSPKLIQTEKRGEELLHEILKYTTDFVRVNWNRVEATTPMSRNQYTGDGFVGGFKRLLATKKDGIISLTLWD